MPGPQTLAITRFAEEGLLGSLMLAACFLRGGIPEHEEDMTKALNMVKAEYFTQPDHARYFRAMQECEQSDLIGVLVQLSDTQQLRMNDRTTLMAICQDTPTCFDLMHYAREVVRLWEQRTGKTARRRGIPV